MLPLAVRFVNVDRELDESQRRGETSTMAPMGPIAVVDSDITGAAMELEDVIREYHAGAGDFARGNPEPIKALFSHREDVTLANPFGPAVRGWSSVSERLDYASSRMSDGEVSDVQTLAMYVSDDLACGLEIERWRSRIGDREEVTAFELRVTTTFRREDETWKIVHRHADPISTPDADGPVRGS